MRREFHVIVRKRAEDQIASAYDWYEQQREGLGEEFLACVREAIEHLKTSADLYAIVYEKFRRIGVRRFPYGVFYHIRKNNRVSVQCVLHNRQSLANLD